MKIRPNQTAGEKLRALATKLNEGNKLGTCSLLLVTGIAVTLAVMSQEVSKEKTSEIRADYVNHRKQQKFVQIKLNKASVAPENHLAWDTITKHGNAKEDHILIQGLLHSLHKDEANPYAIMGVLSHGNAPKYMMIPQDVCTDAGWDAILKATPLPEFATKWGYKTPTTLGEITTAGSEKPLESPEKEPAGPQMVVKPTMPVERTITDTKGRALEGTILSKTDTSISFMRKGDPKAIEIKLDLLSADDQAFIATLVNKEDAKPSVLFLVNQDFNETEEVRNWIANNGFELTIGVIKAGGYGATSYKIPADVKFLTIDPPEVIDQYDILWINRFNTQEIKGKEAYSHFSLAGRRDSQKKLVVIPTHSKLDKKDRFFSFKNLYAGSPRIDEEDRPYVKIDDSFIFCSNKEPHATDEKMREKLLAAIRKALGN